MKLHKKITQNIRFRSVVLLIVLFGGFKVCAQDVITFIDGRTVEAKVLEITLSEIKYRRYSHEDGPLYTVGTYKVHKIEYKNGDVDKFSPLSVVDQKIEEVDEEYQPEPVLGRNGFFVDGLIGVSSFSRILHEGEQVVNPIGFGVTNAHTTGRYTETIPTIGMRFGSKFYFGDRAKNFNHGVQVDWLSVQIHLQRLAGIHLNLLNPGYTGVLKFNETTGIEFNLVGGFNILARDIDSDSFGYFIVPEFDPIYGYSVNPGIKFRHSGFAIGLDYRYAATFNVDNAPTYNTFSVSIGRKF